MATRLYLVPARTPPVSPAFDAGWERTSAAVRRWITTEQEPLPSSAASAETLSDSENVSTSPYDVLLAQLISAPLDGAQTVGGGTLKGRIRASEDNADADYRAQLKCYVVSNDGSTVRGTVLDFDGSALASEFATTLTSRKFPLGSPAATSAVSAQDGDRIVIEVGYRSHNTHTTARIGRIDVRQDAASDLPEDETTTTALDPWFELSEDLSFSWEPNLSTLVLEAGGAKDRAEAQATTLIAEAAGAVARAEAQVSTLVMEVAIANDYGYWEIGLDTDPESV